MKKQPFGENLSEAKSTNHLVYFLIGLAIMGANLLLIEMVLN